MKFGKAGKIYATLYDKKEYIINIRNLKQVHWWTMQFLGKPWKMLGIKLITTKVRRNYLVSEPKYHTTTFFSEILLAIEMKKEKNP